MTIIKSLTFTSDSLDPDSQDYTTDAEWGDWNNRRLRYQLLWSYFASGVYDTDINTSALGYKAQKAFYKYIRELYNPAYRIGSFYQAKVWGGRLDFETGDDGIVRAGMTGALPIMGASDELRAAIAVLWQDSNWKTKRNIIPLLGSVLGDVLIEVVNDAEREKVYLKPVHPAKVRELNVDQYGNVKGYVLEYNRTDDLNPNMESLYTEEVFREDESVVYTLYKNGSPYNWGGEFAQWYEPYGFVPMVSIQHKDMGLDWGFSEAFPKLQLFGEIDDQASKLNDQIRKIVDAQYVAMGANAPTSTPNTTNTAATATKPRPGREESRIIYIPGENVTLEPLVADLNISDALENIRFIAEQLEKEFPELALSKMQDIGGNISGRAIRLLQSAPKGKITAVRDSYDDALVRAQKMAVAIGGYSGYSGYEGFTLGSYESGALNHSIGERDVFARDVMDDLEIAKAQAETFTIINTASGADAGVELVPHLTNEQKDALTGGATLSPLAGL